MHTYGRKILGQTSSAELMFQCVLCYALKMQIYIVYIHRLISKRVFDILENQIWRQFCIRMRSSVSAARTQLSSFYRFNVSYMSV